MTDKHDKKVIESYNKISEWFDAHRNKDLFEKQWLDKALKYIKVGDKILDLGCGTGQPIAEYLIKLGYNVTGIDSCIQFIEKAKNRLPHGTFFTADMRNLSINTKFNLILAWNSFFHLNYDDQRQMFSTFSEYLQENGMLLFTTGPEYGETWSNNGGENLYHASLSSEEYKTLLQHHKFELVTYKITDVNCHDHSVWLARKI